MWAHIGNVVLRLFANMAAYDDQWQTLQSMVQEVLLQCSCSPVVHLLSGLAAQLREGGGQALTNEAAGGMGNMSNRMALLLQRLLGMYFFYEGGGFYAVARAPVASCQHGKARPKLDV